MSKCHFVFRERTDVLICVSTQALAEPIRPAAGGPGWDGDVSAEGAESKRALMVMVLGDDYTYYIHIYI